MKTIALRFSENFSPKEGTIAAHEHIISQIGYVWYGKLGAAISSKTATSVMSCDSPRILLIQSGKPNRYWAHILNIQREKPSRNEIPEYYRDMTEKFSCWFQVTRFEKAANDVMAKCRVASSGELLSFASKGSMSPYFIIEYDGE